MKYTVRPAAKPDCDCEDCRAGKHLYELYRWQDGEWAFVGITLQSYGSAEECQQQHWWGIQFQPADAWEDGTPIGEPKPVGPPRARPSGSGGQVFLDTAALQESAERLKAHWLR